MKHKIIIFFTALFCATAVITTWTEARGREDVGPRDYGDIANSAIHSDLPVHQVLPSGRIEEPEETEEENDAGTVDGSADSSGDLSDHDAGNEQIDERSFRQIIIDAAWELYGVSEEWTIWLIGTTWNEGYQGDRYLEYAWACAVINEYRYWSVWDLDCIWGSYYSIGNAYSGYYAADDTTLSNVYEALVNRDTRIVEVDGMITYPPAEYYLIYDSEIYNCQVWGR